MEFKTVTATEFRVQMNDLMQRVYNGDLCVSVMKHKKVMFMCFPPDWKACECDEKAQVTNFCSGDSPEDSQNGCDDTRNGNDQTEPVPPSRPGKVIKK